MHSKKGHLWRNHSLDIVALILGISLILGLWTFATTYGNYPNFVLPEPNAVFKELKIVLANGLLWYHLKATLTEMMGGLALGLSLAVVLGYVLGKSPLLERFFGPYIVASQSIPIVAIAPLLIIWFGTGKPGKMLICALIVFFPILINTIVGIRSVDENFKLLMHALRASRWQTFLYLEVPAALPVLLGGLKIGVTLSAIGAVVSEFVGADRGLGYLISLSKGMFNTSLMFVALITLTGLSLILYLAVMGLEKWLLGWRR